MPDEPVPDDAAGLRAANARLRAVVEAKDGQVAVLWAITLFPRGFDHVIHQVLALFLFYFPLVFPVGRTRPGLLFGR